MGPNVRDLVALLYIYKQVFLFDPKIKKTYNFLKINQVNFLFNLFFID